MTSASSPPPLRRGFRPIHIASIEGASLRFFAFMANEFGEHLWVCFEDLHSAMGQPADDLERCVEALYGMPAGECRARVATDDDLELIVSCPVAFSYTAAWVSAGRARLSLAHAFGEAAGDAFDVMLKDLPSGKRLARKRKWLSQNSLPGFETGTATKQ